MPDDRHAERPSPYLLADPPASSGRTLLATGFAFYCALHWGLSETEIAAALAGDAEPIDRDVLLGSARLIGGLFARGAIRGWTRPFGGGEPAALKAGAWELDDFAPRFATSAIDPKRPFDDDAVPTHWIFADSDDWNAMIEASVADVPRPRIAASSARPAAVHAPIPKDAARPAEERFLRLPEVERRTGLSRATIYRKMDARRFPKSVSLSQNIAGWRESEVAAWIEMPK